VGEVASYECRGGPLSADGITVPINSQGLLQGEISAGSCPSQGSCEANRRHADMNWAVGRSNAVQGGLISKSN
jgi:hypothetical protein